MSEEANNCLSIETFTINEQVQLVNSPRTLEACKMEGITPEELLYKYLHYKANRKFQR